MENKSGLKKSLVMTVLISVLFIVLNMLIYSLEYRELNINYNRKINNIVYEISEKYPKVKTEDIIKVLNETDNSKDKLKEYGIDLNDDSVILENDRVRDRYKMMSLLVTIVGLASIFFIFLRYNSKRERDIRDITKLIEEINKKNYNLHIDTNSEDELSILKNEIYKTTLMLKEEAENSKKDKSELKKSLEDISHQLKTPLTSIIIMLDNLIDNPDMDDKTRDEFIREIRMNIMNINFFVQNILKLSKLDVNTVEFIKKDVNIEDIINESVKNVSTLSDLKNVSIKVKGDNYKMNLDFKWQVEALSNIIKNAIEYSKINSKVDIKYGYNKVYTYIKVTNYDSKISDKDLPHIFERFYKASNSSENSVGIGLALSKAIIEKEGGTISVTSNDKETSFTIKYFRI